MKYLLALIKKLEILDSVAVRLTVLTGKSHYPIHPKHLIKYESLWFEKYLKITDLVLDLGCDNGMHTLKVARKVKKIIGVEYQTRSVQIAKELAKNNKVKNAQFLVGSLEEKLDFSSNRFDKILFLDVLEHLNNRNKIMKECFRVLKKSGLVFLSVPNSETSWKKMLRKNGLNSFADRDHKIEYTTDRAIKICTNVGFKVVTIEPITMDTPLSPLIGLIGGFSLNLYQKLLDWKKGKMQGHPEETVGFRIIAKKI